MPAGFEFRVAATDGRARAGELRTPHGVVETPAFMPVGTRAALKGLTPQQAAQTGTQIILANTYHLLLRPGADAVERLGGLQRFMGWDGPVLTDSGGFQVFSLADLRELDDEGVRFRSHLDGELVHLTPERSIQVQNQLGADIIMAFDECPPLQDSEKMKRCEGEKGEPGESLFTFSPSHVFASDSVAAAVRRTLLWAERSKAAHARDDQALYGIVQGGLDLDLRRRCLERLFEIGFDGFALGGLSVGEPPEQMWALLDALAHQLPADRPRYLMGVGTPRDLVRAVAAGIDQFDCVLPTRNGRKGYAFTSAGVRRLRNAAHRLSDEPLDPACDCYCCRGFSRGYLRHLFMAGEQLGGTLVSLHNLRFYQALMERLRGAVRAGGLAECAAAFERGAAAIDGGADEGE